MIEKKFVLERKSIPIVKTMTIKELLLRIINKEALPERVIYQGNRYDLCNEVNYYWFDDIDDMFYYLFEGDTFKHLEDKVEVIWKLEVEDL